MTALAALVAPASNAAAVRRMLDAMSRCGSERVSVWAGEAAALGAARDAWQMDGLAGAALVVEREGVRVAADAALYYRDELRQAIARAGVEPPGDDDAAALIAAAYLAWGPECVERLEGDFAFVVWDERRARLVAARDFVGRRTLYYAQLDDALVVASVAAGVLAHPGTPRALNLRAVAATAAGFLGALAESCWAEVRVLPAGHTLVADRGGAARVARHWEPPVFERAGRARRSTLDDGAAELRALLARAVRERLAPDGPTAMWMSGGWDSPPLFAAGQLALADEGAGARLQPVSVSYPVGDPGREDEAIAAIAARWHREPAWVDVSHVPLFGATPEAAAERAAGRDEPLAHVFERWNEALVDRSRSVGARVALDGIGGDALFQVSPVFLADLLAAGRWGELRREWRHHGARGGRRVRARSFVRQVALPALPPALLAAAGVLRGRALVHHRTRRVPAWLDARFARAHDLAELGVPETDRRPGESRAALESRWYLASGWSAAVLSFVSRLALAAGLEVRSPYYDRRVVAFAAGRPREERRAGNETKRLVRAAVRGLLPDEVLAPRTHRTGTTAGYFVRTMQSELPGLMAHLRSFALADVGIVDADALRGAAARFLAHPRPDGEAGNLFFTLQTELWLRAQLGGGTPAASSMAAGDHGGVPRRTPAAPLGRG